MKKLLLLCLVPLIGAMIAVGTLKVSRKVAAQTPDSPPAGMIAASQAIALEGDEFKTLNDEHTVLYKQLQQFESVKEFQRQSDQLVGMQNRLLQDIKNDLANLKLPPDGYEYNVKWHSYVPVSKPAAQDSSLGAAAKPAAKK
jgi:hypothetical protein